MTPVTAIAAVKSTCNRGLKSLGGLRALALPLRFVTVRDRETIDSELRLLAPVRWSIREHGGEPSSRQVDELLDVDYYERKALRAEGLDPDDPAVIAAINLARWELSLAGDDRGLYGDYVPAVA
jgi:hypothetical protein